MKIWTGMTIGQTIKIKSHTSGFDFLRISLAFSIIFWHTLLVCYGIDSEAWFWTGPIRPAVYSLVPSFFVLSGFLIAGSLERNDIKTFLFYRAARIYPALFLEVTLSCIFFGVLFTNIPLLDYIKNYQFYRYLLNVTGVISYTLPGVFEKNPIHVVNAQLWTIPIELKCYIIIVIIDFFGLLKKIHIVATTLFAFGFMYMCVKIVRHQYVPTFGRPSDYRPSDYIVITSFIYGLIFYVMRDRIIINIKIFIFSLIMAWILMLSPSTSFLAMIPLSYVIIYLGVQNPRIPCLKQLGNYSYGIYLYGFSIQQAVYSAFISCRTPITNFVVSGFFAVITASLSWHLVEARILRNRSKLYSYFLSTLDYLEGQLGKITKSS